MSIQRRLYDCASIAGPYVDEGLSHEQADAHYGLIHSTIETLGEFAKTIPGWQKLPLVSLLTLIIHRYEDEFANRAAVMQWAKRKAAYDADRASWKAVEQQKGLDWRNLPMTAPQRLLIADTARILETEVPEGMDRGEASDWLHANGANVLHSMGGESR